jgi:crossover junction endodeoxyribonuclease RuvC
MNRGLTIYEYAPSKAKLAVTGRGNASKEQVAAMLRQLFPELGTYSTPPDTLDATDALSLAVCHVLNHSSLLNTQALPKARARTGKKQNWASFVAQHPDRVKGS